VKIVLCTKQVPSVEEVRFDREKGTIIREGVPNEINPFDRRALGSAIELKKQFGAEVVAVTMGPPQAKEVLWECLAIGADRAVHINDRALAGSDTLATARVLAALLQREQPDLIFCGKYSVDADTGQVGPEVAAMLGIPQVAGATSLKIDGDGRTATVARETDAGIDTLEVELPVLLTASERLTRPPRFDPKAFEDAKSREIETVTAADLGLGAHEVGFAGSPTSVCGINEIKPHRMPVVVEESDPGRAGERVLELLRERHVFASIREDLELEPLPAPAANPRADRAIWVVPELSGGRLTPVTFELLGGAASVAQEVNGQVSAVLIGHEVAGLAAELAERGAERIYVADDPRLAQFDSETYAWVLAQAAREHEPWAILVPATSQGRDYAPRVAGELELGLTGDAVGLEVDAEGNLAQLKPAFGGTIVATILTRGVPQMVTVRAGMLKARAPRPGARASIVPRPLDGLPAPRVRLVKSEPIEVEGGRLDEAEVIVCAGAGLGGPENLHYVEELAEAVHGVVGGTRRVVDAGWLPRQKQIGLTGVIVAPELYIGVGVRGAFNHAIGIQRADTVVAINTDPDAPSMQQADIAVVGDYREIVPALAEAFRRSGAVATGD
jgi:electron transfer flavoprotein alpha subunit